MNEVVPLYVPGNDITCAVAADAAGDRYVMGGRFVAVAGDLDGALPVVGYPVPGSGPVSVGDLLEVGSRGVGVRRVAGYPVARAM